MKFNFLRKVMFILVLSMCCFGLVACSKNEKSDNKKETKQQSIEEKKPLGNLVMKDEEGNVVITVDDIQSAATSVNDDDGMKVYCVAIKFTNEGKEKFAKVTEENVGKLLAIYVDDKVVSTPRIQCAITGGEAIISDAFVNSITPIYPATEVSFTKVINSFPIAGNMFFIACGKITNFKV